MSVLSSRVSPDPSPSLRIPSPDALRGADMLLIIGLDSILRGAAEAFLPPHARDAVLSQLAHCPWEGLAVYDLIFPLFVFISGVSLYLSLSRATHCGKSRLALIIKLWKRALVLAFFGFLINASSGYGFCLSRPDTWRIASVLGLIGFSCALAGTAMVLLRRPWFAPLLAAITLLSVGLLQSLGGDFSPESCFNARVDALLCPGVLHNGCLDPEGPLCIVSASALALLGFSTGQLLFSSLSPPRQLSLLALSGLALLSLGPLCGPIIKSIWSPAFVLTTAGISSLLLLLFRLLCDFCPLGASLSFPLRVIGAHALFVYLFTHILGIEGLCAKALLSFCPNLSHAALSALAGALCFSLSWLACLLLSQLKPLLRKLKT